MSYNNTLNFICVLDIDKIIKTKAEFVKFRNLQSAVDIPRRAHMIDWIVAALNNTKNQDVPRRRQLYYVNILLLQVMSTIMTYVFTQFKGFITTQRCYLESI